MGKGTKAVLFACLAAFVLTVLLERGYSLTFIKKKEKESTTVPSKSRDYGAPRTDYRRDRDRDWDERGLPRKHVKVFIKGRPFFYHHGVFFREERNNYIIVPPPFGEIVTSLPFGYITLRFGPRVYCYLDNVYYRQIPQGYVVVPASEIESLRREEEEQQRNTSDSYKVNVPNDDGTYTEVKLWRSGKGFTGPQGEYYPGHPTVEQLRVLYGK